MWAIWICIPIGIAFLISGVFIFISWIKLWQREGMKHTTIKSPPKLISYGLYSYIRHPHYVSHALISFSLSFFSLFLWLQGVWTPLTFILFLFFIFFPLLWLFQATHWEEKELIEKFGKEYIEYKERVPRFIPRIRKKYASKAR